MYTQNIALFIITNVIVQNQVEDLELNVGDYVLPSYVSNFEKSWNDMGAESEVVETYSLTAVASINGKYAWIPCERNIS